MWKTKIKFDFNDKVTIELTCTFVDKNGHDEECLPLEGVKELKVFTPNYIVLVKKFFKNVKSAKQNRSPKKSIM